MLEELKIDPEFAGQIPPLTSEEFEQLEANILEDGKVINPLITWNGFIVDGHNRYRILQKHMEIPYNTFEKEFPDRYAVIAWICKNQLGRRNLTPAQRKYLIGKQYEAEKASQNGAARGEKGQSGRFQPVGQNDPLEKMVRTSERIAHETGTGERYVRRAEEFAQGLDAADEVEPGIRQQVLSGELKPPDKDVVAIAHAPQEKRKEMIEILRNPKPPSKEAYEAGNDEEGNPDNEEGKAEPKPFHPSRASIEKISAAMESRPDRPKAVMPTAFIIEELEAALESMIFRWDFCLRENSEEASDKECRRQIQELVQRGISYLKLYRGGKKRDEKQ